ncbi:MAG TPA: metalloregulator ArsR/SmtB family transcription factor [Trueperaceae bacterium]
MNEKEVKRDRSRGPSEEVATESAALRSSAMGALAEPNRMRIVELLRSGPKTVGEIADRLELKQPQTSKHLKVLSESGIVEVRADANRRIYRLRPEPFRALDAWLHSFRPITEEKLDQLDEYLRNLQTKNSERDR